MNHLHARQPSVPVDVPKLVPGIDAREAYDDAPGVPLRLFGSMRTAAMIEERFAERDCRALWEPEELLARGSRWKSGTVAPL